MDLPGIGKTTGMMLDTAQAGAGGDRLRRLADHAAEGGENREGLVKAAKEFEGVFLNTLMKAMRKTVPDNELFNSAGPTKFYQQMQDAEMAKALAGAHSGMGVADLIIRQFEATVERAADPAGTATQGQTGGIQPQHPQIGPPAPRQLERYHAMSSVGEIMAERQKLRFFASRQAPAVADTLQRYEDGIGRAVLKTGLEPALILAVVMEESAGDPGARSHKGAVGLMQLMPDTAREMGVQDRTEPRDNLLGGATYLARMLDKYDGDLDLALAAYNAGPGNVDKAGPGVPDFPETLRYVDAVKSLYLDLTGGTELANDRR